MGDETLATVHSFFGDSEIDRKCERYVMSANEEEISLSSGYVN